MKGSFRKPAAWLLMAALLVGMTGGCQKKAGPGGDGGLQTESGSSREPGSQSSQGQQAEGTGSQGPSGEPVAMGRYKETEIILPEEMEEQSLVRFLKGVSGGLEMYTIQRDSSGSVAEAFAYVYRNGSWEKQTGWAGGQVLKEQNLDLVYVDFGQDGSCYLGGTDNKYQYHLLRLEADGSVTELLEEVFKPRDGNKYGLVPPRFEILDNGNILVYGYDQVELYTPSGIRQLSLAKDFNGSTSDARGFAEGKELVTVWEDEIVRYDLETGQMTGSIAYDEVKGSRESVELLGDGEGGIYLAGEAGLAHTGRGGSLWEVLIDGSLTHLGMRSLYLRGFLAGDHGEYYGVFSSGMAQGIQMFCYEYDPDLAAVPPSALTIYSLEDQSTVRQAASQFQSDHPEVRVEFRTAVEKGGTVTEEMIQSLNTELLGGRGADILILDGLPAASYIEKGVLMDLGSLVDELEGSGRMLDNLLEGFRQEDGAIYQIPARVSFPLLLGEEKAVRAYTSLETMAAYQGERPLMAGHNYENLLRRLAWLLYPELFGNRTILEKDGLVRYLETVKALGDANGSKTVFTSEEEMERMWASNYVRKYGIVGSAIHYDNKMCDSGLEEINGFGDLAIPAQVRVQNPQSQMVPAGKIYLPIAMAGINRSTANEELAKDFLRCLLSVEVQKEDLYDGFPVNREALLRMADEEHDGYSVGSGVGDYEISANWPTKEVRLEAVAMLEKLTVPAMVDETIMKMIVEGSVDYLDGKQTSSQAADGILRKLSIYLAE